MDNGPDDLDLELQDEFYAEVDRPMPERMDAMEEDNCRPDIPMDEGVAMEEEEVSAIQPHTDRGKRIRRRDIFLRVRSLDKDPLLHELRMLALEHQWDYVLLEGAEKDGTYYIGLHSQKPSNRVDIRTGLRGLEGKLPSATGIWDTNKHKHMMSSRKLFARSAFPQGISIQNVIGRSESRYFSPASLNQFSTRISEILDANTNISYLLHTKTIKLAEVGHVQRARKAIQEEENQDSGRPDMTEPIIIEYAERDHTGKIIPGGICKRVQVVPHPGDTETKLKHYYVYSARANMGKTRSTEEAFAPYSSATVPDCHNAAGVERDVQWLLLDEYGKTKNKMFELNQLKAICGAGGLCHGFINIKGYDSSYIPRADIQLYITSNVHPFAVYSSRVMGHKGLFLSKSDADTIRARFHIICLDGDEEDEALQYVDIEEMDDRMYNRSMRHRFYKMLEAMMKTGDTTVQDISHAISELWTIHKNRFQGQIINTRHFEKYFVKFIEEDDQAAVMAIFKEYQCHASFQQLSNFDPHRPVTLKGRRQGLMDDYLVIK